MLPMLTVLLSATAIPYVARVPSFGCNSSSEVATLQTARPDRKAFQTLLATKMVYGQCIAIEQGAVVEGAAEGGDPKVLRINARTDPPGYMVPAGDFRPRDEER